MFFLLNYVGDRRWNYDEALVVRATSAEAALRLVADPASYAVHEIPELGDDEVIVNCWKGDPG